MLARAWDGAVYACVCMRMKRGQEDRTAEMERRGAIAEGHGSVALPPPIPFTFRHSIAVGC